jgi:uncharacterized membrane protein YqaE (UPF0057 family)
MKTNLGSIDRALRGVGTAATILGVFLAPVPLWVRVGLGAAGVYLLLTALAGTCLGYRLMGLSTCPTERR